MLIQIVSDLHIEFWADKAKFGFVKPCAPVLALLGDICCVGNNTDFELYKRFIDEVIPLYKHIVIVSGNHEYYYNGDRKPVKENTLQYCDKRIKDLCAKNPEKLTYLNNQSIIFKSKNKSYLIVGSTLWTDIPLAERSRIEDSMNDYKYIYVAAKSKGKAVIRGLRASDVCNMHQRNVKYIKSQIARAKKNGYRMVLLTHHKGYTDPEYNPKQFFPAYESYVPGLFDGKNSPLVLYAFGHTHKKTDKQINGIRVYSNPKGYKHERTGFSDTETVNI